MVLVMGTEPQPGDRARLDRSCLARLGADPDLPVTGWLTVHGTRRGTDGWLYLTGRLDGEYADADIEVLVFTRGLAVDRRGSRPIGEAGR